MDSSMGEIEKWRRKRMGISEDSIEWGRRRRGNGVEVDEMRSEEVFEKRMATFKMERSAVCSKPIPMTENLTRIDNLLNSHCQEMYNSMLLFKGKNLYILFGLGLKM